MSKGDKFPLLVGEVVAAVLKMEMEGGFTHPSVVERCMVVGSVRRKKEYVGDVELLYIPKFGPIDNPNELFPTTENLADVMLERLMQTDMLEHRLNKLGNSSWGDKIKMALYGTEKIPLDLFACTPETWICNVVCRTGSKDTNMQIAQAALKRGWKWKSTGEGFEKDGKIVYRPKTERDVFEAVGLTCLEPENR